MDLHVGLYTFVIRTPQGWHLGTETSRSLICRKWCRARSEPSGTR